MSSWRVDQRPLHTMVCGSQGQPCSGHVKHPATVMQVVLGGLRRGLTMTEAEKAMRRATAESTQGQVRISEAEKDFTSQASCSPPALSQIDPNDPQVNSIQGNHPACCQCAATYQKPSVIQANLSHIAMVSLQEYDVLVCARSVAAGHQTSDTARSDVIV